MSAPLTPQQISRHLGELARELDALVTLLGAHDLVRDAP